MTKRRVLILDDDIAVAKTIAIVLSRMDCDTFLTVKAEDFFAKCATWSPNVIILDLLMPGMDGVEVIRKLAERGCRAKLIITSGVSGRVLDAARRTAVERGLTVAGVLSKPFNRSHLYDLITGDPDEAQATAGSQTDISRSAPDIDTEKLRQGLANREITVALQPKISCSTSAVTGFEVLARWKHPQLGYVSPDRFIPLAEENGQISELTDQILDLGLAFLAKDYPNSQVSLAVNLSARSIQNLDFADNAAKLCDHYGISTNRLCFELTESCAMDDSATGLDLLTRIRIKGFHLSIDDFGTGYSSLIRLVRLPFSELKIDKSFVMSSESSAESRLVVQSTIALAKKLGLTVVAEGVETLQALDLLRKEGCDQAQGYLISAPLPASQIAGWHQNWGDRLNGFSAA